MMKQFKQVQEFHKAFGQPTPESPTRLLPNEKLARVSWMSEELVEYMKADNIVDEMDALVDLLYFTIGTCVLHGVDPEPIFDIVQHANMSKLDENGKPIFDEQGKIRKPEGWVSPEPQIKEYIMNSIYERFKE